MTSECNALETNCNEQTEDYEDTKSETVEIKPSLTPTTHCSHQLIVPQNQHPNRDHNASFASTMNGHLLHFHEEERLEIANEYPAVMNEHEYDVLDLDESIYACSDFKEDLPSISEMSFHSWSLPQSHHREQSHYKHEEIIDSFLKNNEFEMTRSRRKQQKFSPRCSHTTASESMHGIDDIFDSVRRQNNLQNKKVKKAKQKKKKKRRKKVQKVEKIKRLHI